MFVQVVNFIGVHSIQFARLDYDTYKMYKLTNSGKGSEVIYKQLSRTAYK